MSPPGEARRNPARIHAAFLRSPAGPRPDRAATILDLGFEGIVLAAPLEASTWEALRAALPRGSIAAIEVFLPWPRTVRGPEAPFHIASLHAEEKRDGARQAIETVLAAERASIPLVIVPATRMGALPETNLLQPRDPHLEDRIARIRVRRESEAKPRLDSLLGLLSKMLSTADRYGVAVALAPGGHPDEIPSPEEAAACLEEFRGGPLRIWMDTGSRALARSLAPAGYDPFGAIEKEAPAGVTLRDMSPRGEPAPPGRGGIGWEAEKPLLERCSLWAVDPPANAAGESGWLEEAREFMVGLETPPREPSEGILGLG